MAQIQVIDRQADPTAQALSQAGDSIASTIQKQQALKLTGQYYKILAKNAETEQEKIRLDRLAKLNTDFLPQIAGTKDPAMKAMLIKAVNDSGLYNGDSNQLFKDIADSTQHIQAQHQSVAGVDPFAAQQSTGPDYATPGQLAGAQQNAENQQAMLNQTRAYILQHPEVMIQRAMQGMQGTGSGAAPTSSNGQTPPGVANQMLMQGMTIDPSTGQITFQATNPAVDYAKGQASTLGNKMGDIQAEQAPAKAVLGDYEAKLGLANSYAGVNSKDSDFSANIKDKVAAMRGHFSNMNIMEAKNAAKFKLGNQLTSAIEHGRPNLVEINGVSQSIPDSSESVYTQQLKMAGLKAAFALPTTGDPYQDARNKITALTKSAQLGNQVEAFVAKRRAKGIPESQISQEVQALTGGQGAQQ